MKISYASSIRQLKNKLFTDEIYKMIKKILIRSLTGVLLLCWIAIKTEGQALTAFANYVSLSGETLQKSKVLQFNSVVLHFMRSKANTPKGTILLLSGGAYEMLKVKNEGESSASFLNSVGFDVAILEYHNDKNSQSRDLALIDALKAFRLLKTNPKEFGLLGKRFGIIGFASGGHLAARVVQKLNEKEQPEDLILINPFWLNETNPGNVFPAILPPAHPTARLFASFSAKEDSSWIKSCQEYTKTWKGYDGHAVFYLLTDSTQTSDNGLNPLDSKSKLAVLLKTFLEAKPEMPSVGPNPAAVPVEGYARKRHEEKLALIAKEKFGLIFIGNSITHNFEKPEYQSVWNQFFAPRKALNLGTSGYRTENLIWNIQNGELDGQSPKVVILEIGTNNVDEKNYPTRHTAGQLAGGIETIVKLIREKLPDTKIIVLRCFPGCYGGPNPTSHRLILERASDIVSKLADGKHIFYSDVNHVFLNMDGSLNQAMMGDWLHPTPAGAKAWAQAMEPLLSELMGDQSLDIDTPANSANFIKIEKDETGRLHPFTKTNQTN